LCERAAEKDWENATAQELALRTYSTRANLAAHKRKSHPGVKGRQAFDSLFSWAFGGEDSSDLDELISSVIYDGKYGRKENISEAIKSLSPDFERIHDDWKLFERSRDPINETCMPPFPAVPNLDTLTDEVLQPPLPGRYRARVTGCVMADYLIHVVRNDTARGMKMLWGCFVRWHPDKVMARLKRRCKTPEVIALVNDRAQSVSKVLSWLRGYFEKEIEEAETEKRSNKASRTS